MPSPGYMRDAVGNLYGPRWKRRVAKMTDGQVYAIWQKHFNSNTPRKKDKPNENPELPF